MAKQSLEKTWRVTLVVFAVLYVVLAVARLNFTPGRGIIDHDEGHSLLNADTWNRIFRWVLSGGLWSGSDGLDALRDSFHREGGTLYTAGKFGYSLLLALVALPGQVTATEGLILAWLCGLILPVIAGWITWQYTRALGPAMLTATACVTSALLLGLSREVSGTIWALTLTLAGLGCIQHGLISNRWWRWGLPGGALLAAGFSYHFNSAPLILGSFGAAFLFGKSLRAQGERGLLHGAVRLGPAAMAAFLGLALLEIATQVVDYRLRVIFPEYRSMLGDLWKMLTQDQVYMMQGIQYGDGELGWGRAAWWYWWDIFRYREPVYLIILGMCVVVSFRCPKADRCRMYPSLILWLTPLVFYALHPAKVERVLGMVIATGWIAFFVMLWFSAKGVFNRYLLPGFLGILLIQLVLWKPVIDPVSPMPAMVRQTLHSVSQGGGSITAGSFDKTFAPVWKWNIVEISRQSEFAGARSHIDFSRLEAGDIRFQVFRMPGEKQCYDETVAKDTETSVTVIAEKTAVVPAWKLRVIRQR